MRLTRSADAVFSPISAGLVAALSGFASSFALVIAGLRAVGATEQQAASGLFALCLVVGVLCIAIPLWLRIPLSFAWSTPGAALLLSTSTGTVGFGSAVGAFLVCAVLVIASGLIPSLGRAIAAIPKPLAAAMLAGILFPIALAPIQAAVEVPLVGIPVVLTWLILVRFAPRWAVPAAMLVAVVGILILAGPDWANGVALSPHLEFVPPVFDPVVVLSLGLPLFVVTMAGQNVPGMVVMSTFGYVAPPRTVFVATGIGSGVGALFGGHGVNLAAITAAIMASREAHEDPAQRWKSTVVSGIVYVALGFVAAIATALVAAAPEIVIVAVAGLAILGALITGITGALEQPQHRISAVATFLVVASGMSVLGVGSAFWGLVVGGIIMLVAEWRPRRAKATS